MKEHILVDITAAMEYAQKQIQEVDGDTEIES